MHGQTDIKCTAFIWNCQAINFIYLGLAITLGRFKLEDECSVFV